MRTSEAIFQAEHQLRSAGIENAAHESCWMLEELLGVTGGGLRGKLDSPLDGTVQQAFDRMVARRASGEPLQYVIGNVDFFNVRLEVGPGVLIPRPETEELVEVALSKLPVVSGSREGCVFDICTGSGAIALALAAECPHAKVYGTDISSAALVWARRNRESLEFANVELLEGDLFGPLPARVRADVITANPPYVSPEAYETLDRTVKDYEPRLALVAENGGMALLEKIADESRRWLKDGGWLICEIGDEQGGRMKDVLVGLGYSEVAIRQDMAHQDRIAVGCWSRKS